MGDVARFVQQEQGDARNDQDDDHRGGDQQHPAGASGGARHRSQVSRSPRPAECVACSGTAPDRRTGEDGAVHAHDREQTPLRRDQPLITGDRLLTAADEIPALAALVELLGPGYEPPVLLVGGAVRDLIIGTSPLDLDLMIEGPISALASALGGGQLRTHDRFGTATVELGGDRFDIARARSETYAAPGALPDVQAATALDDLRRRDFTVNALGLVLTGPDRGRLLSVPAALDDLAAGRLRVLHDMSFTDDPTRLLRLARYAARLRFSIEPHTLDLAHRAVEDGALKTVSGVRIGNELRLLAAEPDPAAAFAALAALGVDQAIDYQFRITDYDLVARALALLPEGERRDRLVLAAALLDFRSEHAAALLDRLGFSAEDRAAIVAAAARAHVVAARLEMAGQPSEIDSAVAGADPELVALAGAIGPTSAAREWLARLRHMQPQITGADLLAAGVPQGRTVGLGLAAARAALLDGDAPDGPSQLQVALRAASEGSERP